MLLILQVTDVWEFFNKLSFISDDDSESNESSVKKSTKPVCSLTTEFLKVNLLSCWYVDEAALKKFYGCKTAIDALVTYPGVISATVMDLDIDPNTLRDLTQYELECLVWSGGRELGKS